MMAPENLLAAIDRTWGFAVLESSAPGWRHLVSLFQTVGEDVQFGVEFPSVCRGREASFVYDL